MDAMEVTIDTVTACSVGVAGDCKKHTYTRVMFC
jgi:hypothetical protein